MGHIGLNGEVDAEIGSTDEGTAEEAVFLWKQFGILLDAEDGLAKPAEEAFAALGQLRFVEGHGVVEVLLDPLQEFDWLAFHGRARRRSNSERGMRLRPATKMAS